MKKYLPITLIILILIYNPNTISASPHGITDVSYSPQIVYSGTEITISISLADTANISKVGSFYCKIEPEYYCNIPAYVLTKSGNSYTRSFTVSETAGEVIGFDIFIEYENEEKITLPGTDKLDFGLPLAEPFEGLFYYQITIAGENTSSKTSFTGFIPAIIVLLVRKIIRS